MARKKTLSDRSYSVRPSTDQIDPCGALLEELIVLLARIAAREMQADPHLNVAAGKSSFEAPDNSAADGRGASLRKLPRPRARAPTKR